MSGSWFGGSDSRSTSTQETHNTTDERVYADYSEVDGNKSSVILDIEGDDNNVELQDFGAVNASFDFASNLVRQMNASQQSVVEHLTDAQKKTYGLAQTVVEDAQRSETENIYLNLIKWGLPVIGVVSLSMIFMKRGKK